MEDKLAVMHGEAFVEQSLDRIRVVLRELYGKERGEEHYRYAVDVLERYLESRTEEDLAGEADFDPDDPYAPLAGRIFAVCYPDSVYGDSTPTLRTLQAVLAEHFPSIGGMHILPERLMSHGDLWPQDLLHLLEPRAAEELVVFLEARGVLHPNRVVDDAYLGRREALRQHDLPVWFERQEGKGLLADGSSFVHGVMALLDAAFESHFNDGGFSQKDRSRVDPRFGNADDIRDISREYALMLDYVVNHLDFENPHLEAFRRGESDGSAFLIVSPGRYDGYKSDGTLERTFRPRPFPLFTGMRKHPVGGVDPLREMKRRFARAGLEPPDERLTAFLAIAFKVRNDQGLTSADRRAFRGFLDYLREAGIEETRLFQDSEIQPQQKIFRGDAAKGMADLLEAAGADPRCAEVFERADDEVFGEKFFIYTTFSESQVDVNPKNPAGFRLVVDDLFHILASGELAMLRMDAIKYLWKEIGKSNFNMEEGNTLIEALRLLLKLASPRVLPVDEINSPDPVVYEMGRDGGFSYVFGQVNAVPAAFNGGSLEPITHFVRTMEDLRPPDLVPFVMLSTHDGRSVQGPGVQRTDGHVSMEQFYALKRIVEGRGGKVKYRSVPRGRIGADTLHKACTEAGLSEPAARSLFEAEEDGETLRLTIHSATRSELLQALADAVERSVEDLAVIPAVDFVVEWIVEGRTPYELCCTTRSSFCRTGSDGRLLDPHAEACRLALAQLYVLTLGQVVPAVYFNDLLGLENDFAGYELSGKPRDLNRRKSYLPEAGLDDPDDPFASAYKEMINRILDARAADQAFYPGSREFEYRALSDVVFLNHPYARGQHSFILGNISDQVQSVSLDLPDLEGVGRDDLRAFRRQGLRDELSGKDHSLGTDASLELTLAPFGAVWLKIGS